MAYQRVTYEEWLIRSVVRRAKSTDDRAKAAKKKAEQTHILFGKERRRIISVTAKKLASGRTSEFEYEATCRTSLRIMFVLKGYPWARSDLEASTIVAEGLRRNQALRPLWAEGQRDRTALRNNCLTCGDILSDADRLDNLTYCSRKCAETRYARQTLDVGFAEPFYHQVQYQIQKLGAAFRPCQACGRDFRSVDPEVRFCSHECYDRERKVEPATCGHCSKIFQPLQRAHSTFCSIECYNDSRKVEPATCGYCEQIFKPTQRSQNKYCCRTCAQRDLARQRAEKAPEIACACCQKIFRAKTSSARCCSIRCTKRLIHLRKKAKSKRPPPLTVYAFDGWFQMAA